MDYKKLLIVSLFMLSPLLAEVTLTIFPSEQTATWTIYTNSVNGNKTAMYALVRVGTCRPIGLKGELVYNGGTVTIDMGGVESVATSLIPSAEYETVISVNPKDVLYMKNVFPLVWCTNVRATVLSMTPITLTLPGNVTTSIPIYFTTTEVYMVPHVTTIANGPDLIVPTITLSPTTITVVKTSYKTVTLTKSQVITTTGLIKVSDTSYPYALLQFKAEGFDVSVPTTITIYNDIAGIGVSFALTYTNSTTLEVTSSPNTPSIHVSAPALLALLPALGLLGKKRRKLS